MGADTMIPWINCFGFSFLGGFRFLRYRHYIAPNQLNQEKIPETKYSVSTSTATCVFSCLLYLILTGTCSFVRSHFFLSRPVQELNLNFLRILYELALFLDVCDCALGLPYKREIWCVKTIFLASVPSEAPASWGTDTRLATTNYIK